MAKKKDIFDRLMELPLLRVLNPFYQKQKEVLLYLFFGGLTFLISIGSFAFLSSLCGWNELIANVGSWIIAVLFAYGTNRVWVFSSKASGMTAVLREAIGFFAGRLVTLLIEEAILFVFITKLSFHSLTVKIIAQIVVIILNYVISKLYVFKAEHQNA